MLTLEQISKLLEIITSSRVHVEGSEIPEVAVLIQALRDEESHLMMQLRVRESTPDKPRR